MNKEFIPYTEALALKELGFDEPCFGYYNGQSNYIGEEGKMNSNCNKLGMHGAYCTAPTYSQVFQWFRENNGIKNHIYKNVGPVDFWGYYTEEKGETSPYKTYDEAAIACLNNLIEIIKKIGVIKMSETALEVIEYLEKHWKYYDTSCTKKWVDRDDFMILILELSTCGVNENEIIIEKLKNSVFWNMHWHKSLRGGHYTFEIDFRAYGYMMVSEYVKISKTTRQRVYHSSELHDWIHISSKKKMVKQTKNASPSALIKLVKNK